MQSNQSSSTPKDDSGYMSREEEQVVCSKFTEMMFLPTLPYDSEKDEELVKQTANVLRFYLAKYLRFSETLKCHCSISDVFNSSQVWGQLYELANDGKNFIRCISLGPGPLFVCGCNYETLCHYYIEDISYKHRDFIRQSDTAFFIWRVISKCGIVSVRVYNTCCVGKYSCFKVHDTRVKFRCYGVLFHDDIFSISTEDKQLSFQFKEVTTVTEAQKKVGS